MIVIKTFFLCLLCITLLSLAVSLAQAMHQRDTRMQLRGDQLGSGK
ncbi:MAG: hypothetical protein H6R25_2507 [Proteobacteria bacterium]|nr:hypothetical protein [Pseudomonadota bacterium]